MEFTSFSVFPGPDRVFSFSGGTVFIDQLFWDVPY